MDSRNEAQSLNDSQAAGFADDFLKKPARLTPCTAIAGFVGCAWRGVGEGIYLSGNDRRLAAAGFFSKAESLEKVDSRISKETSADAERCPLFCDEKAGLCSGEQGDKTRGLSPQRATNSLLYRAKPNPPTRPKS